MSNLLLLAKRLLVLLLGLALAWFVFFNFFPWVEDRLPLVIAVLVTYFFLAYVGLPALLRVWQMLHKPKHVPTFSQTPDGWAGDPINIAILARSSRDLHRAMKRAGWFKADPKNLKSSIKVLTSIFLNKPYPNAPFENFYLLGMRQDVGYQIPVGRSPFKRHHVRFWRFGIERADHEHHGFWHKLLHRFLRRERQVWLGAAVYDSGVNASWRNLQITHANHDDTTIERDFLVKTMQDAGVLKRVNSIKAGEPLRTIHNNFGQLLISDGYVKVCEVKRQFFQAK